MHRDPGERHLDRHALIIAASYLSMAILWIWASDALVEKLMADDPGRLRLVHSYKGTVYVIATAAALYLAVAWNNARQRRLAAEKRIVEEMLALSQRMEALGTLAGTVVHDFNNVLAIIRGQTEVMKLERFDPREVPQHVAVIESATTQAHGMVRELMQFMRHAPGVSVVGDLGEELRRSEPVLAQAAGSRVKLTIDVDGPLGLVRFEPPQLERTLLNLVINARDALEHSRERAIRIHARAETLSDYRSLFRRERTSGRFVVISIADTGCGISRENFAASSLPFLPPSPRARAPALG